MSLDEDEEFVRNVITDVLWQDALITVGEYAVEDGRMDSFRPFVAKYEDNVPDSVREEAAEFLGDCEKHNDRNVHDLLEDLEDDDLEGLGYYIAMQMLGHGVAWSDDHDTELDTPYREATVAYEAAEEALEEWLGDDEPDDEPDDEANPGYYYVYITKDDSAHGPYALKGAKDFARIGSQHGSPRAVYRDDTLIRVYEDGERVWPLDQKDLKNLTKGEIPRSMR